MTEQVIDDQGRLEPPTAGGEVETLIGFLDFHRATFRWKCTGLDASGLQTTIAKSEMTLGGLLKHMALVENHWFSESLFNEAPQPLWAAVDWEADRDWEWHTARDDSPEDLVALWDAAVELSQSRFAAAMHDGGLDRLADRAWRDGRRPSLRWIVVHMIEEYARHNGHADLLREAVDGATGE